MLCLNMYPNKLLILQKHPLSEERKIRVNLSANNSEDFTFKNTLEYFQYSGGSFNKLLRPSHGMDIQIFFGTAYP